MSSKDQKINIRRNLDEIKGIVKTRHMHLQKDKENMIDYFRKEKSRSGNKNCTANIIPSKLLASKKSNSHHDDCDFNSKKLRTQGAADSHSFKPNMTMNSKKDADSQLRKLEPNGYFLTADVSSVLKVINKNMKLDSSLQKRRVNMMTE